MSSDKTTVAQLHDERVKEITAAEARLPRLNAELEALEQQADDKDLGIIQKKQNTIRMRQIKKETNDISNMRLKYHMDCGFLLNKYMEIDKKTNNRSSRSGLDMLGKKEFNPNTSKKNVIYRSFRSIVDPDYVYVDEDTVNDENYCYDCKCFRVTNEEALMVCPKCSSQVTLTQKYTKPSVNEPPAENKVYEYQRFSHFCNWIDKIQGKENLNVPDYVIDAVKKEIKRERKENCMEKLTEKDVRRYLKKYKNKKQKYDSFYDHSTKILWKVTGIQPLQMTSEMEANLQNMFMAIQEPFEMHKKDRHNFSSYAYILYKFCQLLGYNEFLPKFRLHKNEGLIYKHDCIWKEICEYMGGEEKGWKFIKTYLY